MTTTKNTVKKATTHVDQIITDRITAMLSKGIIPWNRPWFGTREGSFNYVTKYPYSLLNQLLLEHEGAYITYKQLMDKGGKVTDEDADWEIVTFYKPMPKEVKDKNGNPVLDADGKPVIKNVPCLRYYRVIWAGYTDLPKIENKTNPNISPIRTAENIVNYYVAKSGIGFTNDKPSNRAFYSPAYDSVTVPMLSQFKESAEYYSTVFHELTHSTGHESRLDRDIMNKFGDEDYSREELVAEFGSAYICHRIGIDTDKSVKNSAAYIQGWLRALKNDSKMLPIAAARAQKAADFIMDGKTAEEFDTEELNDETETQVTFRKGDSYVTLEKKYLESASNAVINKIMKSYAEYTLNGKPITDFLMQYVKKVDKRFSTGKRMVYNVLQYDRTKREWKTVTVRGSELKNPFNLRLAVHSEAVGKKKVYIIDELDTGAKIFSADKQKDAIARLESFLEQEDKLELLTNAIKNRLENAQKGVKVNA